jgi:glutaredoxin 3
MEENKMKVKVYSTLSCPWCLKAKAYLKEKKIDFEDINVASNQEKAEEMVTKSGQMGVPVFDIGGTIIVGFDENAINAAIGMG